jgi:hypothetical protein
VRYRERSRDIEQVMLHKGLGFFVKVVKRKFVDDGLSDDFAHSPMEDW